MTKQFQRTIEDFVCGHCGSSVTGDGYTNHCPKCLWSKHVDVNPGDRASACEGMMKPAGLRVTPDGNDILHRCEACHHEKWNKTAKEDNMEEIIKISSHAS